MLNVISMIHAGMCYNLFIIDIGFIIQDGARMHTFKDKRETINGMQGVYFSIAG